MADKGGICMSNIWARQGAEYVNQMNRGLGALLGIATGMLCDKQLADAEVRFLRDWLEGNSAISTAWPGDVIHARVKDVLADGVVTEEERTHLVRSLEQLIGGTIEELAATTHVTQLLPYETPDVSFPGSSFCLTGDFVLAPRKVCEEMIARHGGVVKSSVSKKIQFLLVGGLGSGEWKHGSFGTKIEKAMELKRDGALIAIVHEDHWAHCLPR